MLSLVRDFFGKEMGSEQVVLWRHPKGVRVVLSRGEDKEGFLIEDDDTADLVLSMFRDAVERLNEG